MLVAMCGSGRRRHQRQGQHLQQKVQAEGEGVLPMTIQTMRLVVGSQHVAVLSQVLLVLQVVTDTGDNYTAHYVGTFHYISVELHALV